jgi:hypothetical protein
MCTELVLTTNYLDDMDKGLKDRCYPINFNAALTADYLPHIKQVSMLNRLPIPSDTVLKTLIKNAQGCWRDIIGF